ncbi:hypothetical protein G9A89_010043 [Geosiphon pyriformis]|nr:hypothetical protein G9A89_010043 [Geosiphon pyriformis]
MKLAIPLITSTTFKKRDPKTSATTKFKVAITPDTTTLEYYQSIYIYCKQRFNIPDGIEVVKKSVYQYIENHINNYFFGNYNISELGTEDLNSETLATYFYELNFNIIKYCEETYPVHNKGKNKLKQYSKTTPNTPILPKTTANHLQTPEQGTTENQSKHSETAVNEENEPEISEEKSIDSKNEEDEMTTYIAKIPEFNGEDIETSLQEWLDQVTKAGDANGWNAARMLRTIPYFLKRTAGEWFENLAAPFNDWNTFKAAFLKQFTNNNTSIILRNYKLIKKVRPHAPKDLNFTIQHVKRYKMAMEEANHTKLVNLAIGETSSAAEEKIDQLTKKQYQQPPTQHYQVPAQRLSTQSQFTPQNQYQVNNNRINLNNQLVLRNSTQPKPNHYHTQPSYLTISEEQNFHHTAPLEGKATAQQQNLSYNHITISPARIAENANLSDIFPFEFKANESSFLLSNAAADEQKAITAMYTEAEVEEKTIHLILDSGSTGSIITYQLMQQLKRNTPVGEIDNFPFTLDGITIPVKVLVMNALQYQALLTISYQGQHAWVSATCGTFNKRSEKIPAFKFELEEEKPLIETFMALESTSNWADETEQEHFTLHSEPKTSGWNIPYSKPEPKKQHLYIPLKCKDCHKKLSSMGACILPEKKYENHTSENGITPLIDVAMKGGVCNQTCQYALSISEKVKRGTPFNTAYNSALNKLYHYPHNAEMIFDLAITLINGATKEDVSQIKEAEYIEYTMELARFNYENEVEVYYQIASHIYPTQEAQIQQLE